MGGLHSGRTRQNARIDDCIAVDLSLLKKQNLLAPGVYQMEAKRWKETNFVQREAYSHHFHIQVTARSLTLIYAASTPDTEQVYHHNHEIALTSTPCHYGNSRLWFIAPCCYSRVRVLYINPKQDEIEQMKPQCRNCLHLHYESQLSGYVEKHRTYERHLLANYGYTWAAYRYEHELKHRYLKITPELEMLRQRSILDRTLHYINLLLSTQHMLLNMELADVRYREKQARHLKKRNADLSLVKNLRDGIEFERATHNTNLGGDALDMLLATVETLEDEPDILDEEALTMKIVKIEQAQKIVEKELKSLKMAA